jgi:hypothetical protein
MASHLRMSSSGFCIGRQRSPLDNSTPFHTILRDFMRYNTTTAGGITVAQRLADAMAHPDDVVDRVDEGTLVADYPGVSPIACLGSPGAAFVE